MLGKQDIAEKATDKLSLPHVVLALMLKGRKVKAKDIKASMEAIDQVIKLLEKWGEV
ncbi:hypothetical protein ES702_02096 [subsurface metagenome]